MNIHDMTSNLAGITRHAIANVGDTLEHGRDAIEDTEGYAKLGKLASALGAYASVKTLSSALHAAAPGRRMLNLVGLQRRPSTFERVMTGVGIFAAGAAVGAGVALLLAPQSGASTRELLGKRIKTLRTDAEGVIEDVEVAAKDAASSVEQTAQNVMNEVSTAAQNALPDLPGASTRSDDGTTTRTRGMSHRSPR